LTEIQIIQLLFTCAANAGNSEQKRARFLDLPDLVLQQARAISQKCYSPQPFTVFAVTDPKLSEIFAPAFIDRLVHQWLVRHIEPWFERRFIDDSYANRKGKGTQVAIQRLKYFLRKPQNTWYCKMDIQAFFPSIDREIMLQLWRKALPKLPYPVATRQHLDQVATAILRQNPIDPAPIYSGRKSLLNIIPAHKSLFHATPGKGLPIGSLTSQFFANVYLNELDQFIKHQLKIRYYLRYVDDLVILGDDPALLKQQHQAIHHFLNTRLKLALHPHKTVLQRCAQGIDFLGNIVYPTHTLVRQRSVRALRSRIAWFKYLLYPNTERAVTMPCSGSWQRWLALHPVFDCQGQPSVAILKRILATINSYYGLFSHAQTFRLRQHIYHQELGSLQRFFLPSDATYHHLQLKKAWLPHRY